MTPEEYSEEIILPTLREYFADPRNRRKAMIASLVLVHLHDALMKSGKRPASETTTVFFESLQIECPECWSIYMVAISAKHMRHDKSGFLIDNLVERPPAYFGVAIFGLSRFGDAVGGVEAMGGKQGMNFSVDACLRVSFDFLAKKFLTRDFTI